MKISTLIFASLIVCATVKPSTGNYRRVIRGPPHNQRNPLPMKKWHHPQHQRVGPPQNLQQQRPRPIPIHHQQNFKSSPVLGPHGSMRLPLPPMRTSRPSVPQVVLKTTEKPFVSSPAVVVPEYEYHIQTNSIPGGHPNTIKQLDEKGPIHTIPAPNLGPADKPKLVDEIRPFAQAYATNQKFVYEPQSHGSNEKTVVHIQKSHQYQVTEPPSHLDLSKPHAEFLVAPQEMASNQDLYKIVSNYPQIDPSYIPAIQQLQYVTNFPRNNNINQKQHQQLHQQQLHQQQQQQQHHQTKPQYQLFDFDEQRNPNNQMTRVTADYSVKPAFDEGEALAQAQFVQHFFDNRNEHLATNNVEPELKENLDVYFQQTPKQQEVVNLKEKVVEATNSVPISIYVPDNERFDENVDEESRGNEEGSGKVKFEDNEEFHRHSFGKRKKNRS